MKKVIQLDSEGYIVGASTADESPLEKGVYLIPANCVDAEFPEIPEGYNAKWNGSSFDMELIPAEETIEEVQIELTYAQKRQAEYPPIADYMDGVVKGDQAQIDKYIADCLAVKLKYPKE
jgi:hypothetical protein